MTIKFQHIEFSWQRKRQRPAVPILAEERKREDLIKKVSAGGGMAGPVPEEMAREVVDRMSLPFEDGRLVATGCGFSSVLTIELFGGENLYTMHGAGGHVGHVTIVQTSADSPIETHQFIGRHEDGKTVYRHVDDKGHTLVDGMSMDQAYKIAYELFAGWLPEEVRELPFVKEHITFSPEG
jgi:hypothetical protein